MSLTGYFLLTIALVLIEWLYVRLARRYAFFEKLNERSMHQHPTTVRAGGFIFYLAALAAVWQHDTLFYFCLGLTSLALVCFGDDWVDLPKRYRLAVQLLAVGLMLGQQGLLASHWYIAVALLVVGVGLLNAYNFMDGVNGMTAFCGLVAVGTLWFVEGQLLGATNALFPCVLIALLVFSYVNARPQAICFAGDVGSVSMGFIVLYGIVDCVSRSHSWLPVLFIAVYGMDSGLTILYRLYLGQNIVQPHRMHLYQVLVSSRRWSHLHVSALYACVQLFINGLIIVMLTKPPMTQLLMFCVVVGCLSAGYVLARIQLGNGTKKRVGFEKPTRL
ncbi:UDP-N-acetylmuramyl pentapeptide phosphotransferase/UDP-N-acetylglucosamine-1-phosphate transferase-like protein [Spirosoma linguale]|uniref:UDP-N-acetylmuramyl pentapeptide phosphotransferase/UDP-N-acetylglucosamine-1-phosphate transferase-like protein n=1 Tax=Spirosoma linguale (strain ATCC 33905 / DSM 74 / LMG 10896 / Claus 1) TaxID=504472 RepID=D2QJK8_SPILD|nr:UDP-N-acetylmuramyl pentapeptide phosphotransferase/UDP-N- acetylglucosamine-1-phosphate transferase-like protein [Spirosoma linguale DSM 74]